MLTTLKLQNSLAKMYVAAGFTVRFAFEHTIQLGEARMGNLQYIPVAARNPIGSRALK